MMAPAPSVVMDPDHKDLPGDSEAHQPALMEASPSPALMGAPLSSSPPVRMEPSLCVMMGALWCVVMALLWTLVAPTLPVTSPLASLSVGMTPHPPVLMELFLIGGGPMDSGEEGLSKQIL